MSKSVILYTRDGCGLCQQAGQLAAAVGVEVTPVDITRSVELLERYGTSIPVVRAGDRELFWPFDGNDVLDLTAS